MLIPWNAFDPALPLRRDLRRHFQQLFEALETGLETGVGYRTWPPMNLVDAGDALVVTAAVPGLESKDVAVSIHDNVLTVRGERKVGAPEGFRLRRQEREGYRFSRSTNLPVRVDPEKAKASIDNGLLTVTLPKAPEARPRVISVTAR